MTKVTWVVADVFSTFKTIFFATVYARFNFIAGHWKYYLACSILKVKNDHRSKFSNLSNWKEEAWKISGLQGDSNPWPPRTMKSSISFVVKLFFVSFTLHSLHKLRILWQNGANKEFTKDRVAQLRTGHPSTYISNPSNRASRRWTHKEGRPCFHISGAEGGRGRGM